MLNKKFVRMEKAVLRKERAQIQEDLADLRAAVRMYVDTDSDEGGADISEREKDIVLIEILEQTLRDINKALEAIEHGRYGVCERCNNPIPAERLEAKPDAAFCIACQYEAERLSRRKHRHHRTISSNPQENDWISKRPLEFS